MEALASVHRQRAILVVAHQFALGFGGVPESILSLSGALVAHGVRVDVLSKDGFARDVGILPGLPPRGQRPSRAEPGRLDLSRYRAIFVAGAWNPVACWVALRAKRLGVRIVYAPKGNLAYAEFKRPRDLKKFPYLASLELALVAMSDCLVYSSKLERDNSVLTPLFPAKSRIIPEVFAGVALSAEPSRRDGPIRFGFMAEIAPRKGLAELVEAFTDWQRLERFDAELHIAGEPRPGSERYCRSVQAIGNSAPRPDRIIWRGPLRGQAREDFYDDIDFFVCPTRFESFGLTPLEGLWHGKPVMVTQNLGMLEFISDPQSMIGLGQGRPREITAALTTAMTGREAYLAAAHRWRACAHPDLASARLASAFIDAFRL